MKAIYPKLCAFAGALAILAGSFGFALAQSQPQAQPQAQAPTDQGQTPEGYVPPGADQGAAGPAGATRPLEMPILYITAVEVMQASVDPKVTFVRVTGLTSSEGWSAPQLVPFYYGKPLDDVLDLQFIAGSPLESQKADGFVPISALFTVEAGHAFKAIRVRAAENALTLTKIPGSAQTAVKTDDCKQCIGKKFADKGQAPAGAPNVVREEDLPRGFRTVAPSHGVAGIVHNPNRLNLILDDNNTIVMVFWE